jgi:hypothetical protein
MLGSSRVAAQLAASQEGLSSMSERIDEFRMILRTNSHYSENSSIQLFL